MKKISLILFLCFFSSIALSDLGKYEGWDRTWVEHFLTKKEAKEFKKLKTEKEAEEFIMLFWAKRDPTPGTPRNEFKERCEALAKIADKDFSTEKNKGSLTDRGKVLLLLGPPFARREVEYSEAEGTLANEGVSMTASQKAFLRGMMEVWIYRKEQLERLPFSLPFQELRVEFKKEEGQKDYILNVNVPNVLKALAQAKEGWIKSADLKEVPEWAKGMGTSIFDKIAEKIKSGEEALKKETALTTHGFFYDSNNQTYGSMIIFFDENSEVKDLNELNLFLQIFDLEGKKVFQVDEKVQLNKTQRGFYVDRSFLIDKGKYSVLQILGKEDGKIFYSNLFEFDVPDFKDISEEGFWFCLSSDVKPLQTYYENDPFVFGGVKVIPKMDLKFKKDEELWYFYNLFHPALDTETQKPKVVQKIEIYREGRLLRQTKETEPELTPISEGRYVSGMAYKIGEDLRLEKGNYKFKLIIKDLISNKTFSKEIDFEVIE